MGIRIVIEDASALTGPEIVGLTAFCAALHPTVTTRFDYGEDLSAAEKTAVIAANGVPVGFAPLPDAPVDNRPFAEKAAEVVEAIPAVIDAINTAAIFGATQVQAQQMSQTDDLTAGAVQTFDTNTVAAPGMTTIMPEKDSQGVVWDKRIHVSTKTQTKVGSWTRRKGVDDALYARVMGELTAAALGQPLPPTAPPAATAPPPPPPPGGAPLTFATFMAKCTAAMAAGTLTAQRITDTVRAHGVASVPLLGTKRPDLMPQVAVELGLM